MKKIVDVFIVLLFIFVAMITPVFASYNVNDDYVPFNKVNYAVLDMSYNSGLGQSKYFYKTVQYVEDGPNKYSTFPMLDSFILSNFPNGNQKYRNSCCDLPIELRTNFNCCDDPYLYDKCGGSYDVNKCCNNPIKGSEVSGFNFYYLGQDGLSLSFNDIFTDFFMERNGKYPIRDLAFNIEFEDNVNSLILDFSVNGYDLDYSFDGFVLTIRFNENITISELVEMVFNISTNSRGGIINFHNIKINFIILDVIISLPIVDSYLQSYSFVMCNNCSGFYENNIKCSKCLKEYVETDKCGNCKKVYVNEPGSINSICQCGKDYFNVELPYVHTNEKDDKYGFYYFNEDISSNNIGFDIDIHLDYVSKSEVSSRVVGTNNGNCKITTYSVKYKISYVEYNLFDYLKNQGTLSKFLDSYNGAVNIGINFKSNYFNDLSRRKLLFCHDFDNTYIDLGYYLTEGDYLNIYDQVFPNGLSSLKLRIGYNNSLIGCDQFMIYHDKADSSYSLDVSVSNGGITSSTFKTSYNTIQKFPNNGVVSESGLFIDFSLSRGYLPYVLFGVDGLNLEPGSGNDIGNIFGINKILKPAVWDMAAHANNVLYWFLNDCPIVSNVSALLYLGYGTLTNVFGSLSFLGKLGMFGSIIICFLVLLAIKKVSDS